MLRCRKSGTIAGMASQPNAGRPRVLALSIALASALSVAGGPAFGQAASARERCLLERLNASGPGVTVGEIRGACAGLETPEPEAPATGGPASIPPLAASRPAPELSTAPVERRIVSESRLWDERFALLPHRPNYLLPFAHASGTPATGGGDIQRNEVKFQVSFKLPLMPPLFEGRAALFFAYTGQAWWQAYNEDRSSPFREYSHEPEVFASWRPMLGPVLGWTPRVASAGFVHQSNGRSGELSRSWNRLFAELTLDRPDGWWLSLRPWWRIPEDAKTSPDSPDGDDNPEIQRYAGDGELRLGYAAGQHHWTLTARRGLREGGKGAVQLDWSRPTGFSPQLRWYVQFFDGYGESLIDYRARLQRIGFGVMLNDWY